MPCLVTRSIADLARPVRGPRLRRQADAQGQRREGWGPEDELTSFGDGRVPDTYRKTLTFTLSTTTP